MFNKLYSNPIKDIVISITLSLLFCFFFCLSLNPLLYKYGYDGAVFQAMGLAMLKGKIPYVDLFDHKGFLVYCIQAVGWLIHPGKIGIFVLSIINHAVCIYIWMKISRLMSNRWVILPVICTLLLYGFFNNYGNQVQSWALPYISYPIYLFVRYIKRGELFKRTDCLAIGICLGCLAFILLNNMLFVCTICLYILVDYLRNRQYRELLSSVVWVITGCIITCLFFIVFFAILYGVKNLDAMYYGMIGFNLDYIRNNSAGGLANGSLFNSYFFIMIALMTFLLCFYREEKRIIYYVIPSLIVMPCTFSQAYFGHYYIIALPVYLLIFGIILKHIDACFSYRFIKIRKRFMLIGGTLVIISAPVVGYLGFCRMKNRAQEYKISIETTQAVFQEIPPEKWDSIWNQGFYGLNVLLDRNLLQMNRIILPFQSELSEQLQEIGSIREVNPPYIIVSELYPIASSEDSIYIAEHYDEWHYFKYPSKPIEEVILYRRKDL